MTRARKLAGAVLCALGMLLAAGTGAEQPLLNTLDKAVAWVEENHPAELDLGSVRMKPADLYIIKQRMGEGAVLHFTTRWQDITFSDTDTTLDLKPVSYVLSGEELEHLIELVPGVRSIDVAGGRAPGNKEMIPLVEKHPEIEFNWIIRLNSGHAVKSGSTAYSSFNDPTNKSLVRMTSKDLEVLKYAKGLKALDLGHNEITSLDFLKDFPDLELLILGDNPIEDIGILGTMKHLKYLELFSVKISDASPLANCTELLDLNLSYCRQVTDLSSLTGLKDLERFWGTHMDGVSEAQQSAFKTAHPAAEIRFDAKHATSDGWREHPRYDHYIWCLKHSQWIPFEDPLPGK